MFKSLRQKHRLRKRTRDEIEAHNALLEKQLERATRINSQWRAQAEEKDKALIIAYYHTNLIYRLTATPITSPAHGQLKLELEEFLDLHPQTMGMAKARAAYMAIQP